MWVIISRTYIVSGQIEYMHAAFQTASGQAHHVYNPLFRCRLLPFFHQHGSPLLRKAFVPASHGVGIRPFQNFAPSFVMSSRRVDRLSKMKNRLYRCLVHPMYRFRTMGIRCHEVALPLTQYHDSMGLDIEMKLSSSDDFAFLLPSRKPTKTVRRFSIGCCGRPIGCMRTEFWYANERRIRV
jgi:hypothetical protein